MAEGGSVHEVLQQFARSLKTFVQSREFQEQRRLHSLLREAQQAALLARDAIRPNSLLDYSLSLTSSRLRSVSQWELHDPSLNVADTAMPEAEPSELGLEVVEELVRQSEIDFRTLRQHLREALSEQSQITVGQDFSLIKELAKKHLVDTWDHAFLAYEGDQRIVDFLASLPDHKTIVLPCVPTAENLATIAFDTLDAVYRDSYGNHLKLERVRLYETPNCWADATRQGCD